MRCMGWVGEECFNHEEHQEHEGVRTPSVSVVDHCLARGCFAGAIILAIRLRQEFSILYGCPLTLLPFVLTPSDHSTQKGHTC
jgi:hypothetical protein